MNDPYGDQTHNFGVISTILQPIEVILEIKIIKNVAYVCRIIPVTIPNLRGIYLLQIKINSLHKNSFNKDGGSALNNVYSLIISVDFSKQGF